MCSPSLGYYGDEYDAVQCCMSVGDGFLYLPFGSRGVGGNTDIQ